MPEENNDTIERDLEKLSNGTEYEKEVNIVAYSAHEDMSMEEWAEHTTSEPVTETKTVTVERVKLHYNLGEGEQTTQLPTHRVDNAVVDEMIEEQEATDRLRIEIENNSLEERKVSLKEASHSVKRMLFETMPLVLSGGLERHDFMEKWSSDLGTFEVKFGSTNFEERRVLAKEENRTDDDLFETLSEEKAFTMNISMNAPEERYIESWTEEIIEELHKKMAKMDHFSKVRYTSCKITEQREGECYNI